MKLKWPQTNRSKLVKIAGFRPKISGEGRVLVEHLRGKVPPVLTNDLYLNCRTSARMRLFMLYRHFGILWHCCSDVPLHVQFFQWKLILFIVFANICLLLLTSRLIKLRSSSLLPVSLLFLSHFSDYCQVFLFVLYAFLSEARVLVYFVQNCGCAQLPPNHEHDHDIALLLINNIFQFSSCVRFLYAFVAITSEPYYASISKRILMNTDIHTFI